MMPPTAKRPGDDVEGPGSARKRITGGNGGGSGGPSRTGQACDRCKVRKIRCDARPGGCSPCLQNNIECRTTDRITGRAVSRGHTETIEGENNALKVYILDLQQQLRDSGIEPKHPPSVQHTYAPSASLWVEDHQQQGSWGELGSAGGQATASAETERRSSTNAVLPAFRAGCIGDNYLGVSLGNDWLSPIVGTQLSLFGLTIDLAEFLPPESEPGPDPTSYDTFLRTAFGKGAHPSPPTLPNPGECKEYAKTYFNLVQVFTPILHRPDFMKLISRKFYAHVELHTPEKVMLHMVLAIVMFQGSLRNTGDQAQAEQVKAQAMRHYHYAISHVPELLIGHQIQHIQALALICLWLRQQPRLGAAWTFTNMVLSLAIELGLHRSASAWQAPTSERDPQVIEMRKRIFWSLLVIHVTVGGKLGRPMPLRIQDFDIEMPEHINDTFPADPSLSKWQRCSFRAALPGMKLLKILMQVYAAVYSIRADPAPYELSVQRLERELEAFREQLPPEMTGGAQTVDEDRCPALYLQMAEQEIRLILHHPSLRTARSDVYAKNLDICLDASKQLLSAASGLQALRALDTTWYYSTDYLAAIFTTLFTWTQRQDVMSSSEFQQLRADMDRWIDVMGDVGTMLGTGYRLREHLTPMIENQLANISRHIAAKTASAGLASSGSPVTPANGQETQQLPQQQPPAQQPQQQPQMYQQANGYTGNYAERTAGVDMSNSAPPGYAMPGHHMEQPQHQPPYPPSNYYPDHQPVNLQAYPGMGQFDANAYHTDDIKPALDSQLTAHTPMAPQPPPPQQQHHHPPTPQHVHHITPPQQQNFLTPYQPPPAQTPNGYHPVAATLPYSGPAAWRNYAENIFPDTGGQDYMQSATALMALSDKQQHQPQQQHMGGMGPMGMAPQAQVGADGQEIMWPMVQFGHTQ